MPVLAIIAAILLPPLGVFLVRGRGRDFRIALLLTMLAFVPGMVFALTVLFRNRRPAANLPA